MQPLAGLCVPQPPLPNTEYPVYSFPTSLVVRQDPMDNTGNPIPGVRHTFLRQNSRIPDVFNPTPLPPTFNPGPPASLTNGETLMTPYDWLVHLDRPLINQMELLHVTWGRPHDLTQQFITPSGGNIQKFTGSIEQLLRQNPNFVLLYRALDLLRVQPHISGVPLGGRIAGRINLNTVQDKRVWDALLDANDNPFDQMTFVNGAWGAFMGSRTPNMQTRTAADGTLHPCPVPGATVYDSNSPTGDRPILPFGAPTVPTVPPGGTPIAGTSATAYGGGLGLATDTLLRGPAGAGNFAPYLGVPPPQALHPYQSAAAIRKIFNNVTTVSHTFAVWVTVGYFEVEQELPTTVPGVNFTRLGREYFREVPGDTRFQFFAIVDRSLIAVDPASYVAFRSGTGSLSLPQQQAPFFTTLEANAPAGSNTLRVYAPQSSGWYQGQPVPIINPGQFLAVGTGSAVEIVQVQSAPQANGDVTVTAVWPTAGPTLSFHHYQGDCVSNVVPANPGPQPNFDVRLPAYQYVVPFWTRLR